MQIEPINQPDSVDLLECLGQEEALLHVVVGGVGGVDVLHPRETAAHPAVLIYGLEERKRGEERKEGGESDRREMKEVRGRGEEEF